MFSSLYRRIAQNNLQKNYRYYVPRILTEAGLTACFYIMLTLALEPKMKNIYGGEYLPTFMMLGTFILAILSVVLLMYTAKFLMKQRMQEYGLYYALGMEKKHVARVFGYESGISSAAGIGIGIGSGILFYKLSLLILTKMMGTETIPKVSLILPAALGGTVLFFAAVDIMTYLANRIRLSRMNTTELLHSKEMGEREPKPKILLLLAGIAALAAGYYIALTTDRPLDALNLFFIAAFLVISGTYLLFGAGSIFILKALKKNEKFYYNKNHMIGISGMLHRMKRNSVGLASIAILSTCVLVMVSTSLSLYTGMDDVVESRYPKPLYVSEQGVTKEDTVVSLPVPALRRALQDASEKTGMKITEIDDIHSLDGMVLPKDGAWNPVNSEGTDLTRCISVGIITQRMYEAMGGEKLNLKGNEIALCSLRTSVDYSMKILNLNHQKLKVRKWINYFPVKENGSSLSNTKRYGIVVAEESVARRLNQNHAFSTVNCLGVGFKNPAQTYREGEEFTRIFRQRVTSILAEDYGIRGVVPAVDSAWDVKGALKSMYGSFLFLGILLGMVFLFATVLIIYYKQISEGYEDRKRFQIMEKVGMSSGEVKKTIQSQVRMVFFLPLMVAGIHTAVAFPILIELLKVLMLTNKALFIGCGLGAYGMYVLGYGIIYRLTSRIYYRIVR